MKLNKTLALAALVAGSLFAGGMAVQAQDSTNTPPPPGAPPGGPGARRGGPTLEMVTKQLALTDDQKPKVKTVLDDQMQKMKDLRADTSLSQDDRRAKMKEIRDDVNTKMKDILTPDQYTKWEKMSQRRGRPAPTPPPTDAAPSTNAPAAAN